MKKNKLYRGVIFAALIFCLLTLLSNSSLADIQNVTIRVPNNTMVDEAGAAITEGLGFVQLIKGSPSNGPTGIASVSDGKLSESDQYALAAQAPYVGQEIKGAVGNYPDTPASNGGFSLDNQLNHSISTAYYIRYWTPNNQYYANSTSITPWASGNPTPADMTFSNFALYHAASPPTPTAVNAVITGYTASAATLAPDRPIVNLSMTVNTAQYQVTNYEFRVQKISPLTAVPIGAPIILSAEGTSVSNTTTFNLSSSYEIQARVKNNFNPDPAWGPAEPFKLYVGGIPPEPINIVYSFVAPGIVQFGVPFNPDGPDFTVNGSLLSSNTIKNFLTSVKTSPSNISTFGWWNGTQPVGYTVTWAGAVPNFTAVNGAPADANTPLIRDRVYQMAFTTSAPPFSFTLTGKRN